MMTLEPVFQKPCECQVKVNIRFSGAVSAGCAPVDTDEDAVGPSGCWGTLLAVSIFLPTKIPRVS